MPFFKKRNTTTIQMLLTIIIITTISGLSGAIIAYLMAFYIWILNTLFGFSIAYSLTNMIIGWIILFLFSFILAKVNNKWKHAKSAEEN